MDWSAIYEETGDEDGDWAAFSNRLTPILENFSSRGKYTATICYIFTINYILGVGCLGVPYAFLKSGVVLGSLLIMLLSTVAYMTVMWVAETGHRDMEIRRLEDSLTPLRKGRSSTCAATVSSGGIGRRRRRSRSRSMSTNPPTPEQGLLAPGDSDRGCYGATTPPPLPSSEGKKAEFSSLSVLIKQESLRQSRQSTTPSPTSFASPHTNTHGRMRGRLPSEDFSILEEDRDEEGEVVELVLRFLGPTAKSCYQISVMLLMSIGLIAYTQVFVQTFLQQVWTTAPEYLPSLLFSFVVVPLSCVDLAEQIHIQVIMAALRFVSLATLVLGTLVAMCVDSGDSGYRDVPRSDDHVPLFDTSGFSLMFTTAIFSQLFQHSVPGLIRPLPVQDKQRVPRIFLCALCTTGFFYLVIGMSSVYYFGPAINQAINLNFVDFYWGLEGTSFFVKVVVRALSMVVVLFPALDTVSVYPLIANTLGNNLNVSFPHAYKTVQFALDEYTSLHMSKHEVKSLTTRCWRLGAAVPPIIWSIFIADLSLTLQFAGLCGILVALITPALLQYYSALELEDTKQLWFSTSNKPVGGAEDVNPYAGAFSHAHYTFAILLLAVAALAACSFQIADKIMS